MSETTVVVFASQKGGSGKTTLSGHLAVEAERTGGGPVALIDTDPQGSLAKWWNARSAQTPFFAQVALHELEEGIEHLRAEGVRLVVIDTPPAVTSSIVEVVQYADLVIVPTRPSPHDLRAVGPTVDLIEYQKKPLVFVVNSATPRTRITGEMAVALSQHGTVAPVTIHHRVDFAASMIDGRTVGEVDAASRSAQEISALWQYLAERIRRLDGNAEALLAGPARVFDTELLTPVSGPRQEAAAASDEKPALEAPADVVDEELPVAAAVPWRGLERREADLGPPPGEPERRTGEPWRGFERRMVDLGPPPGEPERRASEPWDGIERRKVDRGPPPGTPERRQPPVFGKRTTAQVPAADTSLKRFTV
jgi:chromosome partitioning protein